MTFATFILAMAIWLAASLPAAIIIGTIIQGPRGLQQPRQRSRKGNPDCDGFAGSQGFEINHHGAVITAREQHDHA